jgi:hypothetical protein
VTAEQKRREPKGRILKFHPRALTRTGRHSENGRTDLEREVAIGDLRKYESIDDKDDYARRMIINAIAFTFIIMLTVAGVWLAEAIALLRKNQDCLISGRRNCGEIDIQARP